MAPWHSNRPASQPPVVRPPQSSRPSTPVPGKGNAGKSARPASAPPVAMRPIPPTQPPKVVATKGSHTAQVMPPQTSGKGQGSRPTTPTPAAKTAVSIGSKTTQTASVVSASKELLKLTVSTSIKHDDIGIQTLVGDYADKGTNHGKRYYQKVQTIAGHEHIKVFLYYWDDRDGADFSGWWFGDQLGGSQVWARCQSQSLSPPRVGWKVPWDAPTSEPGLISVDPYKPSAAPNTGAKVGTASAVQSTATTSTTSAAPSIPALKEKVKKATEQAQGVIKTAGLEISKAKHALSKNPTEAVLKDLQNQLMKQQVALHETQNKLTADISEVRKGGLPATTLVTELAKLSPLVKTVQTNLSTELQSVRAKLQKSPAPATNTVQPPLQKSASTTSTASTTASAAQKPMSKVQTPPASAVASKVVPSKPATATQKSSATPAAVTAAGLKAKKEEEEAKHKAKEESDLKDVEAALPILEELLESLEESTQGILEMVEPLVSDPPSNDSDVLKKAFDEIDASVSDVQKKIDEAKQKIASKLQESRNFAHEARKVATTKFTALQTRTVEVQKKLQPLKTFRKDFQSRVQARKSLSELADSFAAAELEVEKASMMSLAAQGSQMSEDEVSSIEKTTSPVHLKLSGLLRTVDQKLKTASQGPIKDELLQLKDRGTALNKKVQATVVMMASQKSGLTVQKTVEEVYAKLSEAEKVYLSCQDAEMPFLKGIEVLPQEESTKAIIDCEAAAKKAEAFLLQTRSFLEAKVVDVKRLNKDLSESATKELGEIRKRLDELAKGLVTFKKETAERKQNAVIANVVEALSEAETKLRLYTEAAKVFTDDLNTTTEDQLRSGQTKTTQLEKDCLAAFTEARRQLLTKQKTTKQASDTAALKKLDLRLQAAQSELSKLRKTVLDGEKLIKGKETLSEQERLMNDAEAEVLKCSKLVPEGTEGASLSEDELDNLGDAFANAQRVVKAASRSVETQMSNAVATLKTALQKIQERGKKAQESLDKFIVSLKIPRERLFGGAYIRQCKKKAAEVEAAVEQAHDAELPYLRGIEVLPNDESTAALEASKSACATLEAAVSEARNFIAAKSLEVKNQFGAEKAKPISEALSELTAGINAAAAQLTQFRKDAELRKRKAEFQGLVDKIALAEADVAKVAEEASKLDDEQTASLSATDAVELCQRVSGAELAATKLLEEAQKLLSARTSKTAKVKDDNQDVVKTLQKKVGEANLSLAKSRRQIQALDKKFLAQRLVIEAKEIVQSFQQDIKQVEAAAAPLLENGGEEFLVHASRLTLAAALTAHAAKTNKDLDALFSDLSAAKKKVSKDDFVAYLTKLPSAIEHPEIEFNKDRLEQLFQMLNSDNDGLLSVGEFKDMFKQRLVCKQSISVTSSFKVSESKTVGKVEPKDIVETLSPVVKDVDSGLERAEVKILSTGLQGFASIRGNQGTVYLQALSAFESFVGQLDKTVEESLQSARKKVGSVGSKLAELGKGTEQAEARSELSKLQSEAASQLVLLEQLKKKVGVAKLEYAKKEAAEKNAHLDAAAKRETEALIGPLEQEVCEIEEIAKRVQAAAKPFVSLTQEEVDKFETPATLQKEVTDLHERLVKQISKARKDILEKQAKIAKDANKSMARAKQELIKLAARLDAASKLSACEEGTVRKSCKTIAESKSSKATAAFREELNAKGITIEQLYSLLAGEAKDRILEEAFATHLTSIEQSINMEHAKLIARNVEVGFIRKRRFFAFVQQYFVVEKQIAITNDVNISKAKTIRKAELKEIIEVLEGPIEDTQLNVTRIRGKSLVDSVEGWITVKGNQGTPFLKEAEKPYYTVSGNKEVTLEEEASETNSKPLRSLQPGEVLELLEGPRQSKFNDGLRARAKAVSDKTTGWLTIRDKHGTIIAEPDSRLYVCLSNVALTADNDIKSKVVGKLTTGEVLSIEEGPVEDSQIGVTRIKGRSSKSDVVGWITLKGNAGTVYAKPSEKHYTIKKDTPFQKAFESTSASSGRNLQEGEAVEVLEGPRTETHQPQVRIKVRASTDGCIGWVVVKEDVKIWSPVYRSIHATALQSTQKSEGAEVIREIAVGETLELIDGPVSDGKELRIRAKAKKDGAVGWITLIDASGKRFLTC